MRSLAGEKGSAAVEAVVSLTTLTSLIVGGFTALYAGFAYVWVERAGYEALICASTSAPRTVCEGEFRTLVSRALPFGQLNRVQLTRSKNEASLDLAFSVADATIFRKKRAIRLPLVRPGR